MDPIEIKSNAESNEAQKNCKITPLVVISTIAFLIFSTILTLSLSFFITFKVKKFSKLNKAAKILIPIAIAIVVIGAEIGLITFIISLVKCKKYKDLRLGNFDEETAVVENKKISDLREIEDKKNVGTIENYCIILKKDYFFSSLKSWPRFSQEDEILKTSHLRDLEFIFNKEYVGFKPKRNVLLFIFHDMAKKNLIPEYHVRKDLFIYNPIMESYDNEYVLISGSNVINEDLKNLIKGRPQGDSKDYKFYYKCNGTTTVSEMRSFLKSRHNFYISFFNTIKLS